MVQAIVTYTITVTNTGRMHPLACGCSLLDAYGTEIHPLDWWVIPDVPTNKEHIITVATTGDFVEGMYTAKARAWKTYTAGTWVDDLTDAQANIIGTVYRAGTGALYGETPGDGIALDEMTQSLTITDVGADITNLVVTIDYL